MNHKACKRRHDNPPFARAVGEVEDKLASTWRAARLRGPPETRLVIPARFTIDKRPAKFPPAISRRAIVPGENDHAVTIVRCIG